MKKKDTVDLGNFIQGKNNVAPETDLPEGSVREALNVNLDKEGDFTLRTGRVKLYSGEGIHSLFERYFVEGSKLKYLETDNTATVIHDVNQHKYMAWCKIHGDIYYSDGTKNRKMDKGDWGIPSPPGNPALSPTIGMLTAGTYQVAICYIDMDTGEMSGALTASVIHVASNAGIDLINIPVSPDGYGVIVYCSEVNGEELFKHIVLPAGTTSHSIYSVSKNTAILKTQFMAPLPGGHIIRHFKSRIYVARDNVLWFSEAMRYGLHNTTKNFFQFPSRIKIVQAVDDGIFVVADKTYFLAGTEPKEMRQTVVSTHTAIEGTGLTMGGAAFFDDENPEAGYVVGYWFSNSGAVLGLPGGQYTELTDDRLAINKQLTHGASVYSKVNGIKQAVTSFSDSGNTSGFKFGAEATSYIIRNGVIIP